MIFNAPLNTVLCVVKLEAKKKRKAHGHTLAIINIPACLCHLCMQFINLDSPLLLALKADIRGHINLVLGFKTF